MFTVLADVIRLIGAAWRLSRRDALIPSEYAHLTPPALRVIGKISRLGATVTGKDETGAERRLRPGERLAAAFEGMSPPYVKLGQVMATRPDIIGFEMADDLGRLQDRMPAFSQKEAVAEIESAFGKPLNDLFTEFSEPVAAASVAQVHKARLKDGQEVAVKILRPQIEQRATREFRAFMRAARFAEALSSRARRMEPARFIETLQRSAAVELDLRMEAGAASQIADNMKHDDKVRAPEVIWPLMNKRVLTLEWINATPISDIKALDQQGVDRKALARKVIRVFLTQALCDGFFHADMHQGNMMIDAEGRIVLIDFGIMGRLDDQARLTFAEIVHGFITRDYQRTAEAHFKAGYVSREHPPEIFAQALRAVGEPLYGRNADQMDMSRVLQQLFDVTELFDMHLRPELVLLQRTMVTVEGVARSLDPEINEWDAAAPVVRDYLTNALGPRQHVDRLRGATEKALEIAPKLPQYVEDIGVVARRLSHDEENGGPLAALNFSQRGQNSRWPVMLLAVAIAFLAVAIWRQ